uniref:Uncharacterized protein n=1 Tax=Fagus sylvatica TaxID=28930 RepID=A0A2N9III5_FAGSY
MDTFTSFYKSHGPTAQRWSYDSLKNFRQISPVVQTHLKKVVVLGGSGFVGLATSKAAVSKGIEVISLCRVLGRSASSFKYGPYIVTSLLAETTILWEPTLEAKALAAQKLLLNV